MWMSSRSLLKSPIKARPLRVPGQSLDEQIEMLLNDKVTGYALFPIFLWVMAGNDWLLQAIHASRSPLTYVLAALVVTPWSIVRLIQLKRELNNRRQGRDGERAVAEVLERLRESGARVFHDIPGDNFNIDHVIIARQGVFAVETKTWSKTGGDARIRVRDGYLLKNGHAVEDNPMDQATAAAHWLGRLIEASIGKPLPVKGVVLFPGWFIEPLDDETKKRVWVLEPKALSSFLEHEPIKLAESDVSLATFHLSRYVRAKST
jgi:Nuclease-related domain